MDSEVWHPWSQILAPSCMLWFTSPSVKEGNDKPHIKCGWGMEGDSASKWHHVDPSLGFTSMRGVFGHWVGLSLVGNEAEE